LVRELELVYNILIDTTVRRLRCEEWLKVILGKYLNFFLCKLLVRVLTYIFVYMDEKDLLSAGLLELDVELALGEVEEPGSDYLTNSYLYCLC